MRARADVPCLAETRSDAPLNRKGTNMARKTTGTLIWTKAGWAARAPIVAGYVDGKPVREKRWFALETENKTRRSLGAS